MTEAGGGRGETNGATPEALARSMRRAAASFDATLTDGNETLRAAEKLLDQVLDGACESRESALDLLTVDALVTRAMGIAACDPDLLAEFPEQAMKRIATR